MIQLAQVTKAFGGRTLLDNVSWQLGLRERVGLCGPNGAGKTTLLKMLAGLEDLDAGTVITPSGMTVGYLPQDGLVHGGHSLGDEARSAFGPLLALRDEIAALEDRLGDPAVDEAEHERMLIRYAEAQDRFRQQDGEAARTVSVTRGAKAACGLEQAIGHRIQTLVAGRDAAGP